MFGMGMGELLLILVVALLVVGPDKLPQAAKAIGKGIRDFRRHTVELQTTIEQDENLGAAVRELKSALRDDPLRPAPLPRPPAPPPPPPTLPDATAANAAPSPPPPAPTVLPASDVIPREPKKPDDPAHG